MRIWGQGGKFGDWKAQLLCCWVTNGKMLIQSLNTGSWVSLMILASTFRNTFLGVFYLLKCTSYNVTPCTDKQNRV